MYVPGSPDRYRSHERSLFHKMRTSLLAGLVVTTVFLGGSCQAFFDTLTITGPSQVEVGQTISPSLTATYSSETTGIEDVTTTALWFSWHPAFATANEGPGVVRGVAVGRAEIVARYGSPVLVASHWVKVVPSTAGILTISDPFFQLPVGTTKSLTVTHDFDGQIPFDSPLLTWSSDDLSVASVDTTGTVTAIQIGTAIITVSYAGSNGTVGGNATVTVIAPLGTLTITPDPFQLIVGNTQALTVNHSLDGTVPSNSTLLTWSSNTASVATVDATGTVTAVGAGTAIITASYAGPNGTVVDTTTVTVIPVMTLTPSVFQLNVGGTQVLAVEHAVDGIIPSNSTLLTWSSATPTVATVDATGTVTAVAAGTAIINVSYVGSTGTAVKTATVTVVP